MSIHHERLLALRAELARRGLDGFVVPLTDEHLSEYVGDYAQRLCWLTGFAGSAGSAVVLADAAAIFVDGRYTLQVREQVEAADWSYQSVPQTSPAAWTAQHAQAGARIGYDPWLHTAAWVKAARAALKPKGIVLVATETNPVDAVWTDRPALSKAPVVLYDEAHAGRSSAAKRGELAEAITAAGADAAVVSALDSIAWTFNLRGQDVLRTPVALAWAILHADATADLFVDPAKLGTQVAPALGNAVRLHGYHDFVDALAGLAGKRVAVDGARSVAAIGERLEAAGARLVEAPDPAVLPKAIKNEVEIAGTRQAHARDGVALTRFLRWVATEAPGGGVDELSATDRLEAFRRETGVLRDLSFDTISGAGPNGAVVHYKVSEKTNRPLETGTLYLVDSGGQYLDGTTDVTRTVAIGTPDAEMRDRFTRVLKGHIALARAVFPEGTRGGQLDALARQHLWAAGLDFAHGTGHGVGHYLAVHEGPQRIANTGDGGAPLQAGMIVSNEPGYYKAGAWGIRIENLLLVEARAVEGAEQPMLGFETLTLAPIDRTLVEPALLDADERAWLDAYHARVLTAVGPELGEADRAWLQAQCAPIG